MTRGTRLFCLALLMSVMAGAGNCQQAEVEELRRSFVQPPDDARIMMRWWWFGPSVVKTELEREMRQMKAGGIGGFEIQPVYPLALDDPKTGIRNFPFLSDEFLEALRFTAGKAKDFGLRMDLTLGTGWPYGGPNVSVSQASAKLRLERVPVDSASRRAPLPDMAAGEQLVAAFGIQTNSGEVASEDLTATAANRDGAMWFPAEAEKPEEIWFFVSSRTGQTVKRAAVGAEGFVIDHYSRAATESYLKAVADRMMPVLKGNPPYAVFCDSLEAFGADWTPDFLEEFRARRGYDLKPRLAALVDDRGRDSRAIRHDWGKTLTELLNDRFLVPMQDWARRNGTRFRIQNYGIPPAVLSSHAFADLPEGEGSQWKILRAARWASSGSHIYGRPVTSSETWTWLHSPSFRATPLDVKAEADRHFLQGINQLIGHGWPYSPPEAEYPGWRLYASAVFNESNPWWIVMPDLALYLQRMSFLLRQGKPANDVAVYLPNSDAWASFRLGHVNMIEALRERIGDDLLPRILEAGYNLDFFDDGALEQVGRVESGTLALGDNRYRIVILPGVESIPIQSLQKLDEFARRGGALIATRRLPGIAPGFRATESDHRVVRKIVEGIFEAGAGRARFVADESRDLAGALTGALTPDVALSPAAAEIGFVHREAAGAQIYFLANTGNARQSVRATFRVDGMEAQLWDPLTGGASTAEVVTRQDGGTTVALDFAPYGSRVVVFSNLPVTNGKGPWPNRAATAAIDLSKGWNVAFGERRVFMETLRPWTEDEETRFYSGVATYEKQVDVPAGMMEGRSRIKLDFGEGRVVSQPQRQAEGMQALLEAPVREAAVVYVNDQRAGSVWLPPYSVDVTHFLRPGENRIRVVVGNLAINYMAGRPRPDYRLLHQRYGERFQPQDMDKVEALAAGILGPVRLVAE